MGFIIQARLPIDTGSKALYEPVIPANNGNHFSRIECITGLFQVVY